MIYIITAVVALVVTLLIVRKFWISFHRTMGLDHTKVTLIEHQVNDIINFQKLKISEEKYNKLPPEVTNKLILLDNNFLKYQQLKARNNTSSIPCEADMFLNKNMNQNIPEVVDDFLAISTVQNTRSGFDTSSNQTSAYYNEALLKLQECIYTANCLVENEIANLEQQKLSNMSSMKRYLDKR